MPSRQLFQGLFFCFYPQPALFKINGVKAKAAQRFGATIEPRPSLQTTHILVARESAQTRPFWRFVEAAGLASSCSVVDNDWCSQCIDKGRLLSTQPFAIDVRALSSPGAAAAGTAGQARSAGANASGNAGLAGAGSAAPASPPARTASASPAASPAPLASPPPSAPPVLGSSPSPALVPASPAPPSPPLARRVPDSAASAHSTQAKRGAESPPSASSRPPLSKRAKPVRARREDAYPSNASPSPRLQSSPALSPAPASPPSSSRSATRPQQLPSQPSSPPPSSVRRASSAALKQAPAIRNGSPPVVHLRAARAPSPPVREPPWAAAASGLDYDKVVTDLAGDAGSDAGAGASSGMPHPNQALLDIFSDFVAARQATGDEFSARAYERALAVLQSTSKPITSYNDAVRLPGFTSKMARLVADVQNDVIPDIVKGPMKEMNKTLALFNTVYGVGPTTARALYNKGCRTLEDIVPYVDDNGRYSIAHHADFVERMSRSEVDVHYGKVKALMADIDARVQCYCMGSYRRGERDCGDIDVVITREGASIGQLNTVLQQLLDKMFTIGFAGYTFSRGSTRWLGATQVDGRMRRMDFLLVPWQELGAAMIYYTGNDTFNRQMRLSATQQSMRLNEKGLYRVDAGGGKELLEGHDEKRIFELLGWTWREPHQRRWT